METENSEAEPINLHSENEGDLEFISQYQDSQYEIAEISPKGHYKRKLGSGAYKTVYRAIDNDTGREVAWNILSTHGLNKKQKEQIRYEIELMKKLQHPNIIKLITAWHSREKDEVVLITEIMTGGSLKYYLQKMQYPRLKLIKQWCRNILSALSYLHSYKPHPIIHRDLKCDNIFVCAHSGEIRIGDFGLSTIMNTSYNKTTVGTPHYMAPELFEERYGPGVDIYSFGMCLVEICTLSTPYKECDSPISIYKKITSGTKPRAFFRIADEDVKSFIELCLKHVDGRPSADELLEHSFLVIEETDHRTHRPVPLFENEIGDLNSSVQSKTKPLEISLMLNTQNPQKITFSFNPNEETSQQIAEEMGTMLNLNKSEVQEVKKCIQLSLDSSIVEEGPISPISIPSKGSNKFIEKSSLVDITSCRNSTPELIPELNRLSSCELKDDIFNIFQTTTSKDLIEISLRLGIVTTNNQLNTDQITFLFNINEDTPELVAEELAHQLDIAPLYILKISELIEQKVIHHLKPELELILPERTVSIRSEFFSSTEDLIGLGIKSSKPSIYNGFEVTPPEFSITSSTRSSHDNSFEVKRHPQSPLYDVDRLTQGNIDEERSMIDMLMKLMTDKDKSIMSYSTDPPKAYSKLRPEESRRYENIVDTAYTRNFIKLESEKSLVNTSKRYSDIMEL